MLKQRAEKTARNLYWRDNVISIVNLKGCSFYQTGYLQ